MISDTELLRRYIEDRSEPAFAGLVQRHVGLVYSAAVRRTDGDVSLAEDVTQNVFTLLAVEASRLQRHTVLSGWLYVATRHAAANTMRAERRRKIRETEAHAMHEMSTPNPSWNQLRPELDRVMDELNASDRDAVLLRYFENRPYAEIGSTFRISEDAARMRVDRALDKLRGLLAQRGISSTAAALGTVLATQASAAAPTGLAAFVTSGAIGGVETMGGAASSLGFFGTISSAKTAMTAAGVVALISLGSAVYHFQVAREARAALAAAQLAQATTQQDQSQRRAVRAWEAEATSRLAESRAAALDEAQGAMKPLALPSHI
jgi:RNA polymerase sigma factor (sigma-70 family)